MAVGVHPKILFPVLALILTALASSSVPAQQTEQPPEIHPLNRLVTVHFDKAPLQSVVPEMLRDSVLKFTIEAGAEGEVTLELKDVPLNQAIKILLLATGLSGRIQDDTLVICPRPKNLLGRQEPRAFQFPPTVKPSESAGPKVRVGLTSGIGKHSTLTVACSGHYHLYDESNPLPGGMLNDAEQVTLTAKDGAIEVRRLGQEDKTCSGPVRIQADSPTFALEVMSPKVKHARYAGVLEISAKGSVLQAVNEVPLDEYVRGVVPTEVPASFHPEAQKALVVAARTYAVRNCDRHKADGYNMCDSIHCQGYAGASRDAEWVNKLVEATRGEIMTYKGEPIYALYSADCGGMTQNSEDSGMVKAPYLKSVADNASGEPCLVRQKASDQSDQPEGSDESDEFNACPIPAMTEFEKPADDDYCRACPAHTWTRTYSAADLEKVFSRSSSTNVGKLISMEFAEYDCSGRVRTVVIQGEDGEKRLTGTRFRDLFGLSTIMSTRMALTVTPDGKYVIEGRGYGHGVGLCQWGADGLAKSDPKWTYIEILRHYYTDIDITVLGEK